MPAMAKAPVVFSFAASPLIVAVGDVTDYTFTWTNLISGGQGVQCAEVRFPDELWITALGSPVPSNGRSWSVRPLSDQWVVVHANGGGDRLRNLESVTITVTALATAPGAFVFDNHIHHSHNCDDANVNGIPVPMTVLPGIVPTPLPTAAPTATPKPTPVPTPVPTPRPTPVATPERSTPTPTPTPTATPTPAESVRPSAVPVPSPSSPGGVQIVRVAPLGGGSDGAPTSLGVGVDVLGLINSPLGWFVPGAVVGLPGLLVLIFVGLQTFGALAWIPAVRRMGNDDDRPRRRPRPTASRGA